VARLFGGAVANQSDVQPRDPGRVWLAVGAAILIIGAGVLAVVSVRYHQIVTVTVRGDVRTTVTGPPGPSVGLISATLGAGFVLLLVAAFFNRVAEVNTPIGGVKLLTPEQAGAAARAAVKAVGNNPEKVAKVVEQIAPEVAVASEVEDDVRRQHELALRRQARLRALAARRKVIVRPGASMDDLIDTLASDAAKDI
jgi:Zn-dependent protease with chaperone function